MEDLVHQLLYAPPDRRAEDIQRAECLHDEIVPTQNYPLEFLTYRITDHRVPEQRDTTLVGKALQPDLRLLIDSLSRSIDLPPSTTEIEESTQELASRMSVSTKTIERWRSAGLRWRWITPTPGSRKRVVFPRSGIDFFLSTQGERAQSAASFSRIPQRQRAKLIARARKLAQGADLSLNQAAVHLARRTERGLETIRQLLEQHERSNPHDPIFADRTQPLTPAQRIAIARSFRRGARMSHLCKKYNRTRSTIYRTVNAIRGQEASAHELGYIALPTFEREDADEVILRPLTDPPSRQRKSVSPGAIAALPRPLQPFYENPLPSQRTMTALLVRYNYLKFRAALGREAITPTTSRAGDLDRFEALIAQVHATRSDILGAALPMVLSVCVRHQTGAAERAYDLIDLIHYGNAHLAKLVEAFDISRNTRFESALTNHLMRELATYRPPKPRVGVKIKTQRILDWLADTGVAE